MKRVAQAIWSELLPFSPVFSSAKVAEVANVSLQSASRDLADLSDKGMVTRVRRGLWAMAGHPDFSPYAVVPHLFAGGEEGYVSALTALNLHGLIGQIPRAVQIVTTSQRPRLETPVGTYEFHRISPDLFGGYGPYRGGGNFDIANPEKALFDTLYLSVRKGRRYAHLPEIEIGDSFLPDEVDRWISRVEYAPLRMAMIERWDVLARRTSLATA